MNFKVMWWYNIFNLHVIFFPLSTYTTQVLELIRKQEKKKKEKRNTEASLTSRVIGIQVPYF